MSTRSELLAGVHRHNKETFDARQDSEDVTETGRTVVEAEPNQRESAPTGDASGGDKADQVDLSSAEESLEDLLQTQVIAKYIRRDELESEQAGLLARAGVLDLAMDKLNHELHVLEEVLRNEFSDTGGDSTTESAVPSKGPRDKDATKESV